MKNFILICVALFISSPSLALGSTVCKMGKVKRHVQIIFSGEVAKAPCEVKYIKEDGSEKVIFSAQSQNAFCQENATEFAGKLTEKGFACSQTE